MREWTIGYIRGGEIILRNIYIQNFKILLSLYTKTLYFHSTSTYTPKHKGGNKKIIEILDFI